MIGIATIPSLPVWRGMFVNIINSPISGARGRALTSISKKNKLLWKKINRGSRDSGKIQKTR